jgi:altronate hydrolase
MKGYLRLDGRKGIRNIVAVTYLVECARHVASEVAAPFRDQGVHILGFPGCFPSAYGDRMLKRLCTHPNVGAVLIVSLGCESFDRACLAQHIQESGRPVQMLVIQDAGGTLKSIDSGRDWVKQVLDRLAAIPRQPLAWSDLVVGTICGGSDATSGLTANPAIGWATDRLVELGATVIFEETGELIGCEHDMARRAATPQLGGEIVAAVAKAARYYQVLGHGSFAPGNADGGLTTIEEKSLGAYTKSGSVPIRGLIKPGILPPGPGLYLLDVVPDGDVRFGFPNISDSAEIGELIACGSHLILFSTGRGSVVGSAISPVIKICANPATYRRMSDDMDVDAGSILEGNATTRTVGELIVAAIERTAGGEATCSERLGHREFIMTYKSFSPLGPDCLPRGSWR